MIYAPEYVTHAMDHREVLSCLEGIFGTDLEELQLKEGEAQSPILTAILPKARLLEFVDCLAEFDFPHFRALSGEDLGEEILLHYDFALFRSAGRGRRLEVSASVRLPSGDRLMPSLVDRFPSAEYCERELIETLGLDFEELPDKRPLFAFNDRGRRRVAAPRDLDGGVH